MNYQHSFHAGNFADVLKHLVYLYCIEYFQKKETPLFILDTHGGAGCYDLGSEHAQKTQEASFGILKLLDVTPTHPLLQRYLSLVRPYLQENLYPGSPCLAADLLRDQDILRVTELHPKVYDQLNQHLKPYTNIHTRLQDGYEALRAYLPPKEKRGMVLIDPPYEIEDEFKVCTQEVTQAYKKCAHGTYLIWYPIKNQHEVDAFKREMSLLGCERLEVTIRLLTPVFQEKLNKAGLLILNPPYLLEENIKQLQAELESILGVKINFSGKK